MSSKLRGQEDGLRVLVVEDNRGVRRMLRFSLRDAGFQVSEAAAGIEALYILEHQPLEAVVLDLGLSDHRGGDVLDWLRRREAGHNVQLPVWVVMSAMDREDATKEYGPLGDHFLAKPFDPWVLVGLLQELVGEKSRAPDGTDRLASGPSATLESGDGITPR